jgi:lambda repressor-like predicted transcriptional regulator
MDLAVRIRIELLKRGISQVDIAREAGCTHQAVSNVVFGRRRSRRLESLIAKAIEIPCEELFGPPPRPRRATPSQ